MSVLQLRRKVMPDEELLFEPQAEPVLEIDKPFPLRTFHPTPKAETVSIPLEPDHFAAEDADHEAHDAPRPIFTKLRVYSALLAVLAAASAYPVLMIADSRLGDRVSSVEFDRSQWTLPWTGATAALIDEQVNEVGWVSDAPNWSPAARLTAKPVFQSALAESLGEYFALAAATLHADTPVDVDLKAAARLAHSSSTASELRAAYESISSYDRRLRRLSATAKWSRADVPRQFDLFRRWADTSQTELTAASRSATGSPIDSSATAAVYAAKARALATYLFLAALDWPEEAEALAARAAALDAWKAAAEFHPLIVFNASPDGWLLGNHATSMAFLIGDAREKTAALEAAIAEERAKRDAERAEIAAQAAASNAPGADG